MPPDADIGERWKCDKLLSHFCNVINFIYITGIYRSPEPKNLVQNPALFGQIFLLLNRHQGVAALPSVSRGCLWTTEDHSSATAATAATALCSVWRCLDFWWEMKQLRLGEKTNGNNRNRAGSYCRCCSRPRASLWDNWDKKEWYSPDCYNDFIVLQPISK